MTRAFAGFIVYGVHPLLLINSFYAELYINQGELDKAWAYLHKAAAYWSAACFGCLAYSAIIVSLYYRHTRRLKNELLSEKDSLVESEKLKRFEKLDDYKPGAGLGLSICSIIAERLGGSLSIDSCYTTGVRFFFTHPCEIVDEAYNQGTTKTK